MNDSMSNVSRMRVVARLRPVLSHESRFPLSGWIVHGERSTTISLEEQEFTFDRVFQIESSQHDIYVETGSIAVTEVIDGYNSTVFAYGQTGSGKTFTMYGGLHDDRGIVPRVAQEVFSRLDSLHSRVQCSFLEIHNEHVRDLLDPSQRHLKVRETPAKGVWVEGATMELVHSTQDVFDLLTAGLELRAVTTTVMNEASSRSHCIFTMHISQTNKTDGSVMLSKLNLVDLAGSERVNRSGAKGITLKEAQKINQSLSCLGKCINALTQRRKQHHIPYRDSKLTHILKESLGGNCKTVLCVTLSPLHRDTAESISTLRFGTRAKFIQNTVTVVAEKSVASLMAEISVLKRQIESMQAAGSKSIGPGLVVTPVGDPPETAEGDEISRLRQLNAQLRSELDVALAKLARGSVSSSAALEAEMTELRKQLQNSQDELRAAEGAFEEFKEFNDNLLRRFTAAEATRAQLAATVQQQEDIIRRGALQKDSLNRLVAQLKDREAVMLETLNAEKEALDAKLMEVAQKSEHLAESLRATRVKTDELLIGRQALESAIADKEAQLRELERTLARAGSEEREELTKQRQIMRTEKIKMSESLTAQTEELNLLMARLQASMREQEASKLMFENRRTELNTQMQDVRERQALIAAEVWKNEAERVELDSEWEKLRVAQSAAAAKAPISVEGLAELRSSLAAAKLAISRHEEESASRELELHSTLDRVKELELENSKLRSLLPSTSPTNHHRRLSSTSTAGAADFSLPSPTSSTRSLLSVEATAWRRILRTPGSLVSFATLHEMATSDLHIVPCKRIDAVAGITGRVAWFICISDRDLVSMHSAKQETRPALESGASLTSHSAAVVHSAHAIVDVTASIVTGFKRRLSVHFEKLGLSSAPIMVFEADKPEFIVNWINTRSTSLPISAKAVFRGLGDADRDSDADSLADEDDETPGSSPARRARGSLRSSRASSRDGGDFIEIEEYVEETGITPAAASPPRPPRSTPALNATVIGRIISPKKGK